MGPEHSLYHRPTGTPSTTGRVRGHDGPSPFLRVESTPADDHHRDVAHSESDRDRSQQGDVRRRWVLKKDDDEQRGYRPHERGEPVSLPQGRTERPPAR